MLQPKLNKQKERYLKKKSRRKGKNKDKLCEVECTEKEPGLAKELEHELHK